MSTQVTKSSRQVYTALDWLGDVGGLNDGLSIIGGLLMRLYFLIAGNPLDSYLLQALFKVSGRKSQ